MGGLDVLNWKTSVCNWHGCGLFDLVLWVCGFDVMSEMQVVGMWEHNGPYKCFRDAMPSAGWERRRAGANHKQSS
jgi:hypothetical protein